MAYQTFTVNQQLTSTQMNTLQNSVYITPKNQQSNATYTLDLTDAGKLLEFTNSGAVTLTIPTAANVGFDIGTSISILKAGTGTVTLVGAGGVTINSLGTDLTVSKQWEVGVLTKRDTDNWILSSYGKPADATIDIKTTGTNYTLQLTDKNKFIKMNITTTENTVTVPLDATVTFPEGAQIHIIQYGSGKTQVVGASNAVYVYGAPGLFLRAQYSSATLLKCAAANTWMLMGDLSAS